MKTHIAHSKPASRPKGFALVATISVMVLLAMVALAMLSLATIEQRTNGINVAKLEAQTNARLALMHAIAKLQSTAGSDQRITTTADIAGKADGTSLDSGAQPGNDTSYDGTSKGLSSHLNGTRYWTGVWQNRATDPDTTIYTQTPSAEHVDWLVSGEDPTPTNPLCAVGANGQVSDPTKSVVLVGANTVGPAAADNIRNYVAAPLVTIGSNSSTTGRYAWWVGDEGTKARNNIRAEYANKATARYQDLVANRRGWEAIDGFEDYPKPGQDDNLEKIISDREIELLSPKLPELELQKSFHAATPYSIGLATNSLRGGLKTDLTYYLENGFPASAAFANGPALNENIIPKAIAPTISGPKWRQLKEFYDIGKNAGSTSQELTVQSADGSDNHITIAPVISELRLLFGAQVENLAATVYRIYPVAKVAVVLANPYGYPLRWDDALEFELISDQPPLAGHPSSIYDLRQFCQYLPLDSTSSACLQRAIMRIPPGVLPAGEARAYTIGQTIERPPGSPKVNIDMVTYSRADETNFEHAIIQKNVNANRNLALPNTVRLDVREDHNTTQMGVELRMGNSGGSLRRITSFELDNGYFQGTTRVINEPLAKLFTKPFGLQLFRFQLSQPGTDYSQWLPTGVAGNSLMGIAGSTLRTYADFNVRADHFKAPISSYNPPPYFGVSQNSFSQIDFVPPGGTTGPGFTRDLVDTGSQPWGRSPFGPEKTILFTFPNKLLSLGQLQHADLTADDATTSVSLQPGNAFANSYATPMVKRDLTIQQRTDYLILNEQSAAPSTHNYYDISYLLNCALWDNYFLSSVPASSQAEPENPNIKPTFQTNNQDLRDPQRAASQIGINGAFNINSTNRQAWIALLSSTRNLKHPGDGAANQSGAFFPRSLEQKSTSATPPTGDEDDSWSGYRRLTDDEIENLADYIVRQVRLRGPFTSLAHFVNRTLLPLKEKTELSRSGPLQAAIDEAGLTVTPNRTDSALADIDLDEDKVTLQRSVHNGQLPAADIPGGDQTFLPNPGPEPVWDSRSADNNPGAIASILADRAMLTENQYREEQGNRSTGIPGWLTQADILQVIGPSISVRSDTFRIRAYGESVDPITGRVKAKAWCEAIVQRTPQFTDRTDPPEQATDDLNPTNKIYGRKFIISSFRWLSSNEI